MRRDKGRIGSDDNCNGSHGFNASRREGDQHLGQRQIHHLHQQCGEPYRDDKGNQRDRQAGAERPAQRAQGNV